MEKNPYNASAIYEKIKKVNNISPNLLNIFCENNDKINI